MKQLKKELRGLQAPVHIIGISAPAGSGKTTISDNVSLKYSYSKLVDVRTLSFATPLKRCVSCLIEDANKEYTKEDMRPFYQNIGDVAREQDMDFFINILHKKIIAITRYRRICDKSKPLVILIDDVRFSNEANYCNAVFGFIPDTITYSVRHRSETPVPNVSYIKDKSQSEACEIVEEMIVSEIDNFTFKHCK